MRTYRLYLCALGAVTLLCLASTSLSQISFRARRDIASRIYPSAVVAEDINGDGHMDVIASNQGSGTISIFYGSESGSFSAATTIEVGVSPMALALADFNKDGRPDIAVANWLSHDV